MSISSMCDAKLIRESDDVGARNANPVERALGLTGLVERQPTPQDQGPQPVGVAPTVVQQLVRWIPTETLTLYVAFVALLSPVAQRPGEKLCAADFGFRWEAVIIFAAATVAVVALVHLAKVRRTREPFRWPVWEMAVAPVAFSAWALSLPDTPLADICGYKTEVGAFLVLAVTALIGLVADALGKQPQATAG